MLDLIKNIIKHNKNISAYKIIETITESSELFFIKKEMDMNRSKKVHYYKVTLFKDFEEDGEKYRGSSTCNIYPTMDKEEINEIINDSAFSSSFVKNSFYPLPKPITSKIDLQKSNFSSKALSDWLPELTEAIFKNDKYKNGYINSAELFLNKIFTHIINSEGIDVSYEKYKGELEIIVNWKEQKGEIELYKNIKFSEFDPSMISNEIDKLIKLSKERALSNTTVKSGKYTVLLTGSPVKTMLNFYLTKSNTQAVYDGISNLKVGENIQGNNIKGDLLNITLDPCMKNSTNSIPYDDDGYPLSPVKLFEKGVLKQYYGDVRHSYYINVEPTGNIGNIEIEGGSQSICELKKSPYVELVSFSDFQLNSLTGDFGGEIRLGWFFDGNNTIPITGGSISGNIQDIQNEMYFSKELQKDNDFIGPKTIKLVNISISGI
ncbi:metallopeptidase TldD-related protein [Haloimpatiens sp. FM7330]|uniref:metallopeptidase TldD-related protein n=1 Tax=Haloimpatiens sp. FM7330 TaxID=3298610 RepID=UPI003637B082